MNSAPPFKPSGSVVSRDVSSEEISKSGESPFVLAEVAAHQKAKLKEVQDPTLNKKVNLGYLIRGLLKYKATDLHLKMDRPPIFRIDGKLVTAKMPEMGREDIERIVGTLINERQRVELEKQKQIDFSFQFEGSRRARCNIYFQKNSLALALRVIPASIPTLDELGLPVEVLKEMCGRPRGIIFITGNTGSGKSTTLASMIRYLNETSAVHILSFEDPIEFVHSDIKASISQREVGSDVHSMKEGLISGLRQDPDIIVIGEVRDVDTMQAALTAAETGHLVITTLHTNDAKSTINRVMDIFPANGKNFVRMQLASSLVGVISQQLLPKADGSGMLPACEVMVKSPTIESYIMNDMLENIPEIISNSNVYYKMQTMNQALQKLVASDLVNLEEALKLSSNPDDLKMIFSGVTREEGYDKK